MNELYNSSLCGIDWIADCFGPAKIQDLVGPLYNSTRTLLLRELYRLIRVSAAATLPSLFQSNNL